MYLHRYVWRYLSRTCLSPLYAVKGDQFIRVNLQRVEKLEPCLGVMGQLNSTTWCTSSAESRRENRMVPYIHRHSGNGLILPRCIVVF